MSITRTSGKFPLLDVRKLSLRFRNQHEPARMTRPVVDGVNFSIDPGTILGLVGSSGAGKSSVARAIMRLVEPDSGEIIFNGRNILDLSPAKLLPVRKRIQMVFQNPTASLSPKRTVAQTLLEPLEHFRIGDEAYHQQKIAHTLETVGLDKEVLPRYPHQFSSGQQQRIAIGRALLTDPQLLIADEAVSALDVSVQAQILQLLRSLQKERGIAILFISHDLAVIRQIADQVAVMYQGQILEHCTTGQFFGQPMHPYTRALLSFAKGDASKYPENGLLRLSMTRKTDKSQYNGCVYSDTCADRLPGCSNNEPAMHDAGCETRDTQAGHFVKCHLYATDKPR